MKNQLQDPEYRESIIEKVKLQDGPDFTVTDREGWSLLVHNEKGLPIPTAGQTVRMYGRGIGYPVRGIAVGDNVYRYETKDQQAESARVSAAESKAKKEREWEDAWSETHVRIEALPTLFRTRFLGFMCATPGWAAEFGLYELMVCEQAAALAALFPLTEGIELFNDMDQGEQLEAFPGMDQGHSGNSFAAMVSLAKLYITDPSLVPRQHGALCALVGCTTYGCQGAR